MFSVLFYVCYAIQWVILEYIYYYVFFWKKKITTMVTSYCMMKPIMWIAMKFLIIC